MEEEDPHNRISNTAVNDLGANKSIYCNGGVRFKRIHYKLDPV